MSDLTDVSLVEKMAQALIDIHNLTPQSFDDEINQEYARREAENGEDEPDTFEVVIDLYGNLLTELWKVLNRFTPNELERVI